MQDNVIQPSNNPWASPVVLVQKKDGTLCFCVGYRGLNLVLDQFPLPRIDDLLNRLGRACYFTLDLASRYWQIPVEKFSRKKESIHHPSWFICYAVWAYKHPSSVLVLSNLKTDDGEYFTYRCFDLL